MSALGLRRLPFVEPAADEPRSVDVWVLAPTLALVGLGLAMVFSASIPLAATPNSDMLRYLKRDAAYVAVGLLAMWGATRLSLLWLRDHAWHLFVAAVIALAGLFVAGTRVNGSLSWYIFFGQSFQPSEMAKVVVVIAAATYFAHFPDGLSALREVRPPFAMLAIIVLLIAAEPDMGTAAVIVMAMFVLFHLAGMRFRYLLAAAAVGAMGAAAMFHIHPYQWARIKNFYFPPPDAALGAGYQKARALIALGSGGWFGRGYCESVEKYFYLPAATTDSILPVVGEELGLLATWAVVALFAILVWRGMLIAGRCPDRFSGLVAGGVACFLGIQAMINMAVSTGCIPPTGVPLPLVSYGGSSLLFSLIGIGLLLNVSRLVPRRRPALRAV